MSLEGLKWRYIIYAAQLVAINGYISDAQLMFYDMYGCHKTDPRVLLLIARFILTFCKSVD